MNKKILSIIVAGAIITTANFEIKENNYNYNITNYPVIENKSDGRNKLNKVKSKILIK